MGNLISYFADKAGLVARVDLSLLPPGRAGPALPLLAPANAGQTLASCQQLGLQVQTGWSIFLNRSIHVQGFP